MTGPCRTNRPRDRTIEAAFHQRQFSMTHIEGLSSRSEQFSEKLTRQGHPSPDLGGKKFYIKNLAISEDWERQAKICFQTACKNRVFLFYSHQADREIICDGFAFLWQMVPTRYLRFNESFVFPGNQLLRLVR